MYNEVLMGCSEGRILVLGAGALAAVQLSEVDSTLDLSDEQRSLIPAAVRKLEKEGRVVTDGPTYRLESWEVGATIELKVSRRSYYDSILLKQNSHWGIRSRTLAVSCVTRCLDGYLIERRSEKVAAMPGRLHLCPAGSMLPSQHPRDTLEQEAFEELGLEPSELVEPRCLGLVYGEEVGVFQLVCSARIEAGSQEIAGRSCSGAWERSDLVVAPLDPDGLASWIDCHGQSLTEAGRSALVMEGLQRWGEAWSEGLRF